MALEPLVLVVDDYAAARAMYAAWLRVSGYRVAQAGSALEALSLAAQETPDAILMDLAMPGIDGFEATRRLKADPRTSHVPVLAVSGHAQARVADEAAAAGCDAFIVKPSPVPEVIRVLAMLIARTSRGVSEPPA